MAFHLAAVVAPPRPVHGRCAAWFTRGGRAATALISFATKYMGSRCQLLNVSRGSTGARKPFATRLTVLARSKLENGSNTSHLVSFPSDEYTHRSYEGEHRVLSDDLTRVPRVPRKRAQKMWDKKFIIRNIGTKSEQKI